MCHKEKQKKAKQPQFFNKNEFNFDILFKFFIYGSFFVRICICISPWPICFLFMSIYYLIWYIYIVFIYTKCTRKTNGWYALIIWWFVMLVLNWPWSCLQYHSYQYNIKMSKAFIKNRLTSSYRPDRSLVQES